MEADLSKPDSLQNDAVPANLEAMNIGNFERVSNVAIGHGASVSIINNIIHGLGDLPTRYDASVQSFLEHYLLDSPFGGREADLKVLDNWLNEPNAPPYALVTAPAGGGKSALLAHWIEHLGLQSSAGTSKARIVYFPISVRFNTNREEIVFASLAARIAHLYGEKIQTGDSRWYRGRFSDYLRRTSPDSGQVLIILDGLDEAAGWEVGADLFPTMPASYLRVVVATRLLGGDADEGTWLSRLGWSSARVKNFSLTNLDLTGVADVLKQSKSIVVANLASDNDIVGQLYKLSDQGDPLLVGLYVEELLGHEDQTTGLTPESLMTLKPGLKNYFERWYEEQHKLWGEDKPIRDSALRVLISICATALGPITREDIFKLAKDEFGDTFLLKDILRDMRRWIIGDGSPNNGYVFSHTRLSQYFLEELTEGERSEWQQRFVQYGRESLRQLEADELKPDKVSAYIVRYYGAHLDKSNASAELFYALLCENWLRAWEWVDGTPSGFLSDVERAWKRAEAEDPIAVGKEVLASLCRASVVSQSANIGDKLLLACVRTGVIDPPLGLMMARQQPEASDRVKCLAGLAQFLPMAEKESVLEEALDTARKISDHQARAMSLNIIAEKAHRTRLQEKVLGESLAVISGIENGGVRAMMRAVTLSIRACQLPRPEQLQVFREALSEVNSWDIKKEEEKEYRGSALVDVASYLPEDLQGSIFDILCAIENEKYTPHVLIRLAECLLDQSLVGALSSAREIKDRSLRTKVLGVLLGRLPQTEQRRLIEEVWKTEQAIKDEQARALVLTELALHIPEKGVRTQVLERALIAADAIANEEERAATLGSLSTRLDENNDYRELIDHIFEIAVCGTNEWARVKGVKLVAVHLPLDSLDKALKSLMTIEDELSRMDVLGALISRLPDNLLEEAQRIAECFSDNRYRAIALSLLAERLSGEERAMIMEKAVTSARAILEKGPRADTLGALANCLSEDKKMQVLGEALEAAHAIRDDDDSRARVLGGLASRFPKEGQAAVFHQALSASKDIQGDWSRARLLIDLIPQLPDNLLGEILTLVMSIQAKDPVDTKTQEIRADALSLLAQRLPENERHKVWDEVVQIARSIKDEDGNDKILNTLLERLPSKSEEAVDIARYIRNRGQRGRAFASLVDQLPESKRSKLLEETAIIVRELQEKGRERKALDSIHFTLTKHLGTLIEGLLDNEKMRLADEVLDLRRRNQELEDAQSLWPSEKMEISEELKKRESENMVGNALMSARSIDNKNLCAEALIFLAERLPVSLRADLFKEALIKARGIDDEALRAEKLSSIAEQLPEPQRTEEFTNVLNIVRAIDDHQTRSITLSGLLRRLPDGLLDEAFIIACSIHTYPGAPTALSQIVHRWLDSGTTIEFPKSNQLSIALDEFSGAGRSQLLQAIEVLIPVIKQIGGAPALCETADAIMNTGEWWP